MAKQGKERIIAAAFQLFLEKGYKGVSLKDIITTTQLSKGAIYHHFKSKYEIYLAALEKYFFKMLLAEFPDDDNLPVRQRLRIRFEYFISQIDYVEKSGEHGIAFPIRTFFIFQLESEQDAFILEQVQKGMHHYRLEVTGLVQRAIDNNEIEPILPASIIAQQLMSMIEGIVIHHSAIERHCKAFLMNKYDEVIDKYLDLIVTKTLIEKQTKYKHLK